MCFKGLLLLLIFQLISLALIVFVCAFWILRIFLLAYPVFFSWIRKQFLISGFKIVSLSWIFLIDLLLFIYALLCVFFCSRRFILVALKKNYEWWNNFLCFFPHAFVLNLYLFCQLVENRNDIIISCCKFWYIWESFFNNCII